MAAKLILRPHTAAMPHGFQQIHKSEIEFMNIYIICKLTIMVRTDKRNNFITFCKNGVYLKKKMESKNLYYFCL